MHNLDDKNNFFWFETNKFDKGNHLSYYFFDPVKKIKLINSENIDKFFNELEELTKKYYVAGFFSYEFGYLLDDAFNLDDYKNKLKSDFPYALFCAYENPAIFDHKSNTFTSGKFNIPAGDEGYEISSLELNISESEYTEKINTIRDYIRKGDTYQVNYTIKYKFDFQGSPLSLYQDLKKKQNVAYNVFAKIDDYHILSLSPELFFHKSGNKIITRPMKGTLKRGRNVKEDIENIEFLKNDKKNKSENVMIVDLLRNDMGKVSKQGSVKVTSLYDIEKYNTLFQMTSSIESNLNENLSTYELIKSIFPSGSITGAPKIRSMEIINELEDDDRKIYTGSIGFFEPSGNAKFNVVIRTILLNKGKGEMGIGGGIVYDSTPEGEFLECKLKAKFLTEKANDDFQLIETMLFNKKFEHLNLHISRLKESAKYFNYKFNEKQMFLKLNKLLPLLSHGKYKIRMLLNSTGHLEITHTKLEDLDTGYNIIISENRTNSNDIFYLHKTTNRTLYKSELEKARGKGFFDAIFLNEKNEITEGSISNIYIKKNQIFYTPPVECGLLDGTIRKLMLKKENVEEKILTLNDLFEADNIYISNSIIGLKKTEPLDNST